MTNVIVAFSKAEDAKSIRNILVKRGVDVAAVCTSGSQAIHSADELGSGILVCGSRFADMIYHDIYECLPKNMVMLLLSSPSQMAARAVPSDVVNLSLPLKVHEFMAVLELMMEAQARKRRRKKEQGQVRTPKERESIALAKEMLLAHKNMTEEEAHKYIQKCSMDSGTNMAETAEMIRRLIEAERN